MKRLLIFLTLAGVAFIQSNAQQRVTVTPSAVSAQGAPAENSNLTKFDLDFPGGVPRDLVNAIEKASGKPLNIVIPIGAAEAPLPPLKMRSVTVPELFNALQMASQSTTYSRTRTYSREPNIPSQQRIPNAGGPPKFVSTQTTQYSFYTADKPPRDESVWFFSCNTVEEPKACRFWQLAPYLDNYTIDDITTAIQTGYRMLEDTPPNINFHKDTKLLIAVGEESKLALIDAVLQQLQQRREPVAATGYGTGYGSRIPTNTPEPVKNPVSAKP